MAVEDDGGPEVSIPMMLEGKSSSVGGRSWLGLWVVTSQIRQPRVPRALAKGRKESEKEEVCPNSSSPHLELSGLQPTLPGSPPNSKGWQKPSKVARQRLSGVWSGKSKEGAFMPSGNSAFGALGPLGDVMDLGRSEEATPRDAVMSDPGVISLKKARSPPKLPHHGWWEF